MFHEHKDFIQPSDEDVKLWRYMDFTKFVSFLNSQGLYFTRSDKFEDSFEGSLPLPYVQSRVQVISEIADRTDISQRAKDSLTEGLSDESKWNEDQRRYVALNCWHMNPHESAAMWKLYLQSSDGIAIQSTYERLKESIIDSDRVYIGCVSYIDYEKDGFRKQTIFTPFVHKRKSFEHEREIRACIWRPSISRSGPGATLDMNLTTIEHGAVLKVDVKKLVQRVYVSPTSQSWFVDLVKSVIQNYGFDFEIVHSDLYGKPLF